MLESRRQSTARFSPEQKKKLQQCRRDHRWHPHQLRHNAATELSEFGIEVARVILGHRSAAITEVYAEMDAKKAIDVMALLGDFECSFDRALLHPTAALRYRAGARVAISTTGRETDCVYRFRFPSSPVSLRASTGDGAV